MFDLDVARTETEVTLMRRVAMITGANRGIDAATALLLVERGFVWSLILAPARRRRKRWSRPSPRRVMRPWRFKPMSRRRVMSLGCFDAAHVGSILSPEQVAKLTPAQAALRAGKTGVHSDSVNARRKDLKSA
jgi:hypothetical protein